MRGADPTQLVDGAQQVRNQAGALFAGSVLLEQQVAQVLFQTVGEHQSRVLSQVLVQAVTLIGFEVVTIAAHQ